MTAVYLLLGSNLNIPSKQLEIAHDHLRKKAGIIIKKSPLYHSTPWGVSDQPDFVNQVVLLNTKLKPLDLLDCLQDIELQMGRKRVIKWGSRIIDIDILYYDKEIIATQDLKIPHPEIQHRRFTLIPLCDIAPEFIHPVLNIDNQTMLSRCDDKLSVVRNQ